MNFQGEFLTFLDSYIMIIIANPICIAKEEYNVSHIGT